MKHGQYSAEIMTVFYSLSYLPFIMLTRYLAGTEQPDVGRPLTGLEILPAMLIVAAVLTYLFGWWVGWFDGVHKVRVGGLQVPFATRQTFVLGLCTAVVIATVPLSYTLIGVSIPLIQLLMRGDILIIAPLVDTFSGRRVRWWSWVALALVGLAMIIAFIGRGSLLLPFGAVVIVVLYTIAYFGRLWVMTHVSKDGDRQKVRTVFLEERVVGFPAAILGLALFGIFSGDGGQAAEIRYGLIDIWFSPAVVPVMITGFFTFATGLFSTFILLDARENSFCVPLERSASILAGLVGSMLLATMFGLEMPSSGEFIGGALLVTAIIVLTIAPVAARRRAALEEVAST